MRSLRANVIALLASAVALSVSANSTEWNYLYDWQQIPAINTREAPLVNQSSRGLVGTGENLLIGGFVIQTPTNVLIRGIGPTLANFGITNPVSAPQVILWKRTTVNGQSVETEVARNSNWVNATAQPEPIVLEDVMRRIGAFTLSRTSGDAAIYLRLEPGVYTAHLVGRNGATGIGLLEIYLVPPEIDPFEPSWWAFQAAYMTQPWAHSGLAPKFITGNEFSYGYRLQFTADSELSITFAAGEFVNRPGQPPMPRTVVLPRVTVQPLSPDLTEQDWPATQLFTDALDSNGWYSVGEMRKTGPDTWQLYDMGGSPYVSAAIVRRTELTFINANSGTFTMRYSKGVYNAATQRYDEGLFLGQSTGTFVFNRLMGVNGWQTRLEDSRGWWVE